MVSCVNKKKKDLRWQHFVFKLLFEPIIYCYFLFVISNTLHVNSGNISVMILNQD